MSAKTATGHPAGPGIIVKIQSPGRIRAACGPQANCLPAACPRPIRAAAASRRHPPFRSSPPLSWPTVAPTGIPCRSPRPPFLRRPAGRTLLLLALAGSLGGCTLFTPAPDLEQRRLQVSVPEQWQGPAPARAETTAEATTEADEAAVLAQWWTRFNDPLLDQLIAQGPLRLAGPAQRPGQAAQRPGQPGPGRRRLLPGPQRLHRRHRQQGQPRRQWRQQPAHHHLRRRLRCQLGTGHLRRGAPGRQRRRCGRGRPGRHPWNTPGSPWWARWRATTWSCAPTRSACRSPGTTPAARPKPWRSPSGGSRPAWPPNWTWNRPAPAWNRPGPPFPPW